MVPGKWDFAPLLTSRRVEIERTTMDKPPLFAKTVYTVFLDGDEIGIVYSKTVSNHTTYRGTRIRRDLADTTEFFYRSADGKHEAAYFEALRTRTGAVNRLVELTLTDRKAAV